MIMKKFTLYDWILMGSVVLFGIQCFLIGYNWSKPRPIIYQVDSWDGQVIGRVEDKIDDTMLVNGDYYLLNEEQFDAVEIGDKVIGWVRKGE